MSIYKNISDGLYFSIHNDIMDVLNPYDDDDNVYNVKFDEDNRRFEIEMTHNDKSYNKSLFGGLRPRFNSWEINPFRKMEFNSELQTIFLYLKAESTIKKIWTEEQENDYQKAQLLGEQLLKQGEAERQTEERKQYEQAKERLPKLEKELEDINTGKITLKPVKKWKRVQTLESSISWDKKIISNYEQKQ